MASIHEQMFGEYVRVLRLAKAEAEQWWAGLLSREQAMAGSAEGALARCQRRWPLGPASHPRVLAVYRSYYFQCALANAEAGGDEPGPDPAEFVTEWLVKPETEDLALFIAALPMAPIGMDLDTGDEV